MTIVSYLDENDKRVHKSFDNYDEGFDFFKRLNKLDIPYIYEVDRLTDELTLSWKYPFKSSKFLGD